MSFLTLFTVFTLFDSSKLYKSKALWDNFSLWQGTPPLSYHLHKQGRNRRGTDHFISLWLVSDDHMHVSVFMKLTPTTHTNQRLISYTSQGINAPQCVCVCVLMFLQITHITECLITYIIWIWVLTCTYKMMSLQITPTSEWLITNMTVMRPFPSMCTLISVQTAL